ncbi:MAG: TMEM175 family protein [Methanoregula sp.]|jgi:uncharacterized membrane protein
MEPISKVNLERITNGIYAFTMTLMVRNISIPLPGAITTGAALEHYLDVTALSIVDFIGAFIILAMFWLFNFQIFHRMKTVDFHFIHIHLLSLMVVVFVPFTQSFTDDRSSIPASQILFQINYLILALLLVYAWHYARTRPVLLEPDMNEPEAEFLAKKFLVPLGVAVLGILLVIAGFPYIDILYLLPFAIIAIFFRNPPGDG